MSILVLNSTRNRSVTLEASGTAGTLATAAATAFGHDTTVKKWTLRGYYVNVSLSPDLRPSDKVIDWESYELVEI